MAYNCAQLYRSVTFACKSLHYARKKAPEIEHLGPLCRLKVMLRRHYGWLGVLNCALPILVPQFPLESEYMPENHMDPFDASNEVPV
jgi:hypothetical protein